MRDARSLQDCDLGPGFNRTQPNSQLGADLYSREVYGDDFENDFENEDFPDRRTDQYSLDAVNHAGPSGSRLYREDVFRPEQQPRSFGADLPVRRQCVSGAPPERPTSSQRCGPRNPVNAQLWLAQMDSRSQPIGHDSWRSPLEEQAKRRRLQREFLKPYLSEMANAHAERRSPVIHVPTTTTCKPIGLRSAWHRQVRLIARQSMDHSIRSYRGKKGAWWKAVEKIYIALSDIFTYDYPLCIIYLSKYLKGTVKNDRLEWKDFFIENKGAQHEKCPDEAFGTLRKYWLSVAGKEESENMAAVRALRPRKSNSIGSEGPMSTALHNGQEGTFRSTSSIPSGSTGMGESILPTSSSAREASTRGSAPEQGGGQRCIPEFNIAVRYQYLHSRHLF
ncbi:hypothetical protein M758_UG317100 [Ceratodon purpureus]|nr:hypothetical protein M758_UG317100 [Ceratodon purpureus]